MRPNDAYGDRRLPKSMGDKSVNRLRPITQTSQDRRSGGGGGRERNDMKIRKVRINEESLSEPAFTVQVFLSCEVFNSFKNHWVHWVVMIDKLLYF